METCEQEALDYYGEVMMSATTRRSVAWSPGSSSCSSPIRPRWWD